MTARHQRGGSAVNLAAVAGLDDSHDEALIDDLAHKAIVADAIFPKSGPFPRQRLADGPRIGIGRKTVQEFEYSLLGGLVELSDLIECDVQNLNGPNQAFGQLPRACIVACCS